MQGGAKRALQSIIAHQDIRVDFPPAVLAEISAIQRAPGIDDPSLTDLTRIPFVTIDYTESRDLDQAMHIQREGDGFLVRYALADAAYYVRPDSALFAEALARGVSLYLPGLTIPMLPRELCEDLVSLLPGVDRRAVVFELHLDRRGLARRTKILRGRIRSQAKLSYDWVQARYDAGAGADSPWAETLALLAVVGQLRLADARQRDVIAFDRADTEVDVDPEGSAFCIRVQPRNDASRYNEQISLLCNIEGARLLVSRGKPQVQPVFRVHEPPPPAALTRLRGIIGSMVRAHGLPPEIVWRDAPRESLADYLLRLRAGQVSSAVVQTIERQALYTGQRSTFSAQPGQHYALGVSPYARFSAPMREIVGVFTHKEALEMLQLEPPADDRADERLRDQVIAAANSGKERQQRLEKRVMGAFIDQLLTGDLELPADRRPARRGTIVGISPNRLYVLLDDSLVDLKVYLEGSWELQEEAALVGPDRQFTLGDVVHIRTQDRDSRGRWRLIPVA